MKKIALTIALASICASGSALAQQGYVGLSIGQSNTSFNNSDYSLGISGVSESQDRDKTGWKLYGGYDFNKNFALEGGYVDFGTPKISYTGTGIFTGGSGEAKAKESAWFIAGKGTLPLSASFNLFAKLGATWNRYEINISTNNATINSLVGLPYSKSKTKTDITYGIGAEYTINKNTSVRFEYEDFGKFGNENDTGRASVDIWSIGVAYKF